MSHPNLSAGLNALVEAGQSPTLSFQLRDASAGQVIEVCFGENPNQTKIAFKIERRAGPGWGPDAAQVVIVNTSLQPDVVRSFEKAGIKIPPINEKAFIVGACTKNPGAPMGWTMLQLHRITKGRNLLWIMAPAGMEEISWLFPEEVSAINVLSIPN